MVIVSPLSRLPRFCFQMCFYVRRRRRGDIFPCRLFLCDSVLRVFLLHIARIGSDFEGRHILYYQSLIILRGRQVVNRLTARPFKSQTGRQESPVSAQHCCCCSCVPFYLSRWLTPLGYSYRYICFSFVMGKTKFLPPISMPRNNSLIFFFADKTSNVNITLV